jgi:hypothetical protein
VRTEGTCKTRGNSNILIFMFLVGGGKTTVSVMNCSNHLILLIFLRKYSTFDMLLFFFQTFEFCYSFK